MDRFCLTVLAAAGLLVAAFPVGQGHAQATRTWVSGVGNDADPCSRTAPCRTFAGAQIKTADKGEISVLDPGGFGTIAITKSLSIISEGSEGGILGSGTNGIIINAPGAVVNLHGLFLEGAGSGIRGIRIVQAAAVHIRKCLIRGFRSASADTHGIEIVPTTVDTKVFISDCTIADNLRGILVQPSGAGTVEVHMDRVEVQRSHGIGVRAVGAGADVWMSNSKVRSNGTGLNVAASGVIHSYGNNIVVGNTTDGSFTDVLPMN